MFKKLYHGSSHKITGPLQPILVQDTPDHIHTKPSVFATERKDLAALFMFPEKLISSIGFEQDIPFICIWGTNEEFNGKKLTGYLYIFNSQDFEKVGKEYEWQSFKPVSPVEVKEFPSVIDALIDNGVQVYFINDDPTFDKIVEHKFNRAPILKDLTSENQKRQKNIKIFTN